MPLNFPTKQKPSWGNILSAGLGVAGGIGGAFAGGPGGALAGASAGAALGGAVGKAGGGLIDLKNEDPEIPQLGAVQRRIEKDPRTAFDSVRGALDVLHTLPQAHRELVGPLLKDAYLKGIEQGYDFSEVG